MRVGRGSCSFLVAVCVAVSACTEPLARLIVEPSAGRDLLAPEVSALGEQLAGFRDLFREDFGADTVTVAGARGVKLHAFLLHPGDYGLEWTFAWQDEKSFRSSFRFDADSLDLDSAPTPRGTVVVLHGLFAESLQLLPQALSFAERGYRVVLLDLRAHGESGGKYVTFGVREGRDLAALVDHLREEERIVRPLVLYGTSLGASTALRAAATGVEAERVVAVAAAADPRAVIAEAGPEMLPGVVRPLLTEGRVEAAIKRAQRLAGFSFDEAELVPMASYVDVPVLLVHARGDELVPFEQARRLHRALPCSTLRPVDRHGHASLLMDVGASFDTTLAWLKRETACRPDSSPTRSRGERPVSPVRGR